REDYSDRIRVEYYEAGHMMYCHEPSRLALSQHLSEWVTEADAAAVDDPGADGDAATERRPGPTPHDGHCPLRCRVPATVPCPMRCRRPAPAPFPPPSDALYRSPS